MEQYILNRLPGFPLPHIFKEKYKKVENIEEIDENWINKDVIILIKYLRLISGNIHKDFLYIGKIIEKDQEINQSFFIIYDTRIKRNISLRKTRFINNLDLYILHNLK